jgi:hypothetical protein
MGLALFSSACLLLVSFGGISSAPVHPSIVTAPVSGATWSSGRDIGVNTGLISSVSCPSRFFCMASAGSSPDGSSRGSYAITYTNGVWSKGKRVTPASGSEAGLSTNPVSCSSASFCAAGFGGGYAYTYSTGTWSSGQKVGLGPYGFSSVSCPTATFCAATLSGGDAYMYDNGSWSQRQELGGALEDLTSVSCPSSSFCVAVGSQSENTYFNGVWSSETQIDPTFGDLLQSVSCPSSSFCIAVNNNGSAYTYADGTWSNGRTVDRRGHFESISCPTTGFCMAVDSLGAAFTYSNGTWSDRHQLERDDAGLNVVTCASATFCIASGREVFQFSVAKRHHRFRTT